MKLSLTRNLKIAALISLLACLPTGICVAQTPGNDSTLTVPVTAVDAPMNGFEIPNNELAPAPATAPNGSSKNLFSALTAGGPLMIPIALCSFILVIFSLERVIALRRGRIIPGVFSKKFLEQLRAGDLTREQAIAVCEKNESPVSRVFLAGVQKWGRSGVEVEQAILDSGERVSNELRRYLRLINGIANVCPLLGLLGTVFGMIESFEAISAATGLLADQKAMTASGISTALITTAAGMSVAIPALILYLWFSSIVERRVTEIDSLGMKVVSLVSAEALTETTRSTSRSKKAA